MGIETSTDILTRKVQFALELLDPFTGAPVWKGIKVEARASGGRETGVPAIVNLSGRFVWLDTGDPAPQSIAYEPDDLPYQSGEVVLSAGLPASRLVNVILRPTSAYDIPLGVTAIRGSLYRRDGGAKRPVSDAIVQLAWAIEQAPGWIPPAPSDAGQIRPGETVTNEDGEFLVFARLPKPGTRFSHYVGYPPPGDPGFNDTAISPELVDRVPKARLQFTRLDIGQTRVTPADFRFLENLQPGQVPEGRLLLRDLQLDWNELN
jgi:hypothetical protein